MHGPVDACRISIGAPGFSQKLKKKGKRKSKYITIFQKKQAIP